MILPVPPADCQNDLSTEAVDLLKQEFFISEKPLPFLNNRRAALCFIFPLPKQKEFDVYVEKWHQERGAASSLTDMAMCPSYQKIIGLGKEVGVPLIVRKMIEEGDKPDFWFWALNAWDIDNPPVIPEEAQGKFKVMAKIWINWGKQKYANVNWL